MSAVTSRTRDERGFTIIELLVVMAIISILLGLVAGALHKAMEQARIAAMKTLLGGLKTGLETYKQAHGVYPPDRRPDLTRSSECLVLYLSGSSICYIDGTSPPTYPWRHGAYSVPGRSAVRECYPFDADFLTDTDKSGAPGYRAPELFDPWGRRLIYNSGASGDGEYNQLSGPRYSIHRFDLFSAGPDKKYGTEDDIASWGSMPNPGANYDYDALNAGDY